MSPNLSLFSRLTCVNFTLHSPSPLPPPPPSCQGFVTTVGSVRAVYRSSFFPIPAFKVNVVRQWHPMSWGPPFLHHPMPLVPPHASCTTSCPLHHLFGRVLRNAARHAHPLVFLLSLLRFVVAAHGHCDGHHPTSAVPLHGVDAGWALGCVWHSSVVPVLRRHLFVPACRKRGGSGASGHDICVQTEPELVRWLHTQLAFWLRMNSSSATLLPSSPPSLPFCSSLPTWCDPLPLPGDSTTELPDAVVSLRGMVPKQVCGAGRLLACSLPLVLSSM